MTSEEINPEKTIEGNDKTIKWHEKMIKKAREDIRYREDEILKLKGKTEICPHCMGEGRIMTVHRFMGPHKYMVCPTCNGDGKIPIDKLEEYNKADKE